MAGNQTLITINVLKFQTLVGKEAVWSGSSLFAILWIPPLRTDILFEIKNTKVLEIVGSNFMEAQWIVSYHLTL